MEQQNRPVVPDNTALRTALWRAMHVLVDAPPYIIADEIGYKLISPGVEWRQRPDMDQDFTKRLRASVVGRARFIEDLIVEESKRGIGQYVILGAGLDSFAQRRPDIAARLQIFEIDQPDTLSWKRARLIENGYTISERLHFVAVDFEISSWWQKLLQAGFDPDEPAVIACTGVTLYLTEEAINSTLRQLSALAAGSKVAIAFYLPIDLLDEEDKFLQGIAEKGAKAAGTPFISFFPPDKIIDMARLAGFRTVKTVSVKELARRYFANRADGLYPASGEEFLLAAT